MDPMTTLGARRRIPLLALAGAILACSLVAPPAEAGIFGRTKAVAPRVDQSTETVSDVVQLALDEERYTDAGHVLDQAFAAGKNDSRLILQSGWLHLANGRYEAAIRSFSAAEASPALAAQAAEGRGLALSQLKRSDEAVTALRKATSADAGLWRAWNALGVEYDRRKAWTDAEAAYAAALLSPKASAVVYSNRGYSYLLQGRHDEAATAFVAALQKDPGLSQARTNLRLALAMRGEYSRATAVSTTEDRAGVLNNAGFVAMMRGDLDEAETLFNQAIEARGRFYGRAYENLAVVRSMKAGSTAGRTP